MVYLDEAGVSNPAHEPFVVMAGIIVHADQQWKSLERYLSDLADEFAPPEKRDGFIFHAKELFSGGKTFNREDFPKEKRWEILDYLVAIPEKFEFGIAWGFVERAMLAAKYPQWNRRGETARFAQAIAFSVSSYGVELYMKYLADDDEVASLIVENNNESRKLIRQIHQVLRDPKVTDMSAELGFEGLAFARIVDTVHFAEKGHSSPLQVADACAFAIKRHLMGAPESDRFYEPLKRRMIMWPKKEVPGQSAF